jgi:hypothetical protein
VLSFTIASADFLPVLKAAEAFRKAQTYGILDNSLFFSADGCGLLVQAFAGKEAFAAWLPAELPTAEAKPFSLSLPLLFSFVKATKGKGFLSFNGKSFQASEGGSLSIEPAPSFDESAEGERARLYESKFPLSDFLKREGLQEGFPLAPLFCLKGFPSRDAAKLALNGFGFSDQAFCATDGFLLRESPCNVPLLPKAEIMPERAWLPSWLLSVLESIVPTKGREELLGFWEECPREELAMVRFNQGRYGQVYFSFRLSTFSSFPNYRQLFPDQKYKLSFNRKAFLSALSPLLSALKASAGNPHVTVCTDGAIGQLSLKVEIMRDTGKGSKYCPDLESIGFQEAETRASFCSFPESPFLSDAFWEQSEAQQEEQSKAYEQKRAFLVNATFLERMVKSFASDRLELSWSQAIAPITFADGKEQGLLMPVQKR